MHLLSSPPGLHNRKNGLILSTVLTHEEDVEPRQHVVLHGRHLGGERHHPATVKRVGGRNQVGHVSAANIAVYRDLHHVICEQQICRETR